MAKFVKVLLVSALVAFGSMGAFALPTDDVDTCCTTQKQKFSN